MKTNPYRLVEYILLTLLGAALVTALCIIVTLGHAWHIMGWIVAVIVGLILAYAGVDEWNARKRLWDFTRAPKPADGDIVRLDEGKS